MGFGNFLNFDTTPFSYTSTRSLLTYKRILMASIENIFKKIIVHCKKYGFVFQSVK